MTIPLHSEQAARVARSAHIARSVRVALGVLAGAITLGFLVVAAADPTPGSVLSLGAGTLVYVLASFGAET